MLADLLFLAGLLCGLSVVLMLGWLAGREYERSSRRTHRVVVIRHVPVLDEVAQRRRKREAS